MLKRGFKAEAERHAVFYRNALHLKDHDPLPARSLAEHLEIKILTPSDIPGITSELLHTLLVTGKDYWSAAIFCRDGQEYIIHNPTHSAARQESNLMHEIAHSICGHELKNLETALMGCIIPLRTYDQDQEEEADWLGGCLQLPKAALFYYVTLLKKNEPAICGLFTASAQMVRYRISMTGVRRINLRK